jgi:nucleoside-diphosphate-sugar epimerase
MSNAMNKPVCAITGSNGYVGGCVKNYFAANGWDILELTRRPRDDGHSMFFELGLGIPGWGNGNALVHCAYDFRPLRWDEIERVNVKGSRLVLESARRNGYGKIVYISSISAFENCRSLYSKAKLEIEKIALDNGALVIRPGLVYGDGPGGMFGKLAEQIRNSSVIPMIGDGSQIQFLVHNEDLSAFIEKYAAEKIQMPPAILTAAHAQPWPFKELLMEIARGLGKNPKFIPLPWRLVWLGLKSAEICGLKLNFRSDSLVSLMHQNPSPDFSPNAGAGLVCRPFEIEALRL